MMKRRAFLGALGLAISDCLLLRAAIAQGKLTDTDLVFYAGRSGRFGYESSPKVLIGGLLATEKEANRLEADLVSTAEDSNFSIALRYSSNLFNLSFYRKAVELAFTKYNLVFSGVRLAYRRWPSDPAVQEYWRGDAEAQAIQGIARGKSIRIRTLKHDFDSDQRIYAAISEGLPAQSSFKIYPSTRRSPRVMQFSGVLAKCLNAPERLDTATADGTLKSVFRKSLLVQETFSAFSLNSVEEDVIRKNLILRNMDY